MFVLASFVEGGGRGRVFSSCSKSLGDTATAILDTNALYNFVFPSGVYRPQ